MSLNARRARRRRRPRDSYRTGSGRDRVIFTICYSTFALGHFNRTRHVTFANLRIQNIDRRSRRHSFILTRACIALLLFNSPFPKDRWRIFDWPNKSTELGEAEIDSALQQAATASLGQREAAIIVMDAQTGRIRALMNPQLAFGQAVMPAW